LPGLFISLSRKAAKKKLKNASHGGTENSELYRNMSNQDFEYEVAFSFCKEDESLAAELDGLLRERLKTFLYSKKQEDLAGKDGEQIFNEIFGEKARIVVILYREACGSTPWTRFEQTAIRNRAFDDGYDFCIFIPTMPGILLPKWVPKNRLWVGLERWGVKAAAAVIEARVQEKGGALHVESTVERAQRIKREMDSETERRKFLDSISGVQAAKAEVLQLFDALGRDAASIEEKTGWAIEVRRDKEQRWIELYGGSGCVAVDWKPRRGNTLDKAFLEVGVWDVAPPRLSRRYFGGEEPPNRLSERYTFDRTYQGSFGWRGEADEFISSDQLADYVFRLLMDFSHQNHMKN
jgi:hypothetical protein